MSRYYSMYVTIKDADPARTEEIKAAAKAEWPLEDWYEHEGTVTASGDSNLCGGESEEKFAERLSKAIWQANGGFCTVAVHATYMEDLPYETYCLDEEAYRRVVENDRSSRTVYRNRYRCPCGEEWEDEWECMCNDRCPRCNLEIEPFESHEIPQKYHK